MTSRRALGLLAIAAGAFVAVAPLLTRLGVVIPVPWASSRVEAQERVPNRREFTLTAKDFRFTPARIEVSQNDLVKLTIRSEDVAYGFTIDAYRVSKRIPAGGTVTFEFRVDTETAPGTYPFYSNMTNDPRHGQMKGELVVHPR